MVKRIGTQQRKTRHKFKKHYREKGKISLGRYFQQLQPGDVVSLKVDSQLQNGQPFRRFHGFNGIITGKRGFCYEVKISDGHKQKILYVHPIHLIKQR